MKHRKIILTALWWLWGLFLFLLLISLSQNASLFPDPRPVWEWFLPNILPTLTMVGATAYAGRTLTVKYEGMGLLFLLCVLVSAAYLGALTHALLATQTSAAPLSGLQASSLYLGPLQGLATSLLGVFFVSPPEKAKES